MSSITNKVNTSQPHAKTNYMQKNINYTNMGINYNGW